MSSTDNRLWLDAYSLADMPSKVFFRRMETISDQSEISGKELKIICDESILIVSALKDPQYIDEVRNILDSGVLVIERAWSGNYAIAAKTVLEASHEFNQCKTSEETVSFQVLSDWVRSNAINLGCWTKYAEGSIRHKYFEVENELKKMVEKYVKQPMDVRYRFNFNHDMDPMYFIGSIDSSYKKYKHVMKEYQRRYAIRNMYLHNCTGNFNG